MRSSLYRVIAGAVVALSLFGSVSVAQASSLTTSQISAIIGLLQSFGADQGTITNVSTALGGGQTTGTLTCASFNDVTYGQFDNNSGGRVSQLQTWLGIPSSAFGFGTYGKKTQAAWQSKCGGATVTSPVVTNGITLSATPSSGATPLSVDFGGWTASNEGNYSLDFGDGTGSGLGGDCGNSTNGTLGMCGISHTYTTPGTYIARLTQGVKACNGGGGDACVVPSGTPTVSSVALTVTSGSTSNAPFATIDQNNVTPRAGSFSITGSIHNSTGLSVFILTAQGGAINFNYHTDYNTTLAQSQRAGVYQASTTSVANGRWSASFAWSSVPEPTTIGVLVYDSTTHALLTKGALMVNGSTSVKPSVTIDQSSLTSTTGNIALTGTAINLSEFVISYSGMNKTGGGWVTVTNGKWRWPAAAVINLPVGTYTIQTKVDNTSNTVIASEMFTVLNSTAAHTLSVLSVVPATEPVNASAPEGSANLEFTRVTLLSTGGAGTVNSLTVRKVGTASFAAIRRLSVINESTGAVIGSTAVFGNVSGDTQITFDTPVNISTGQAVSFVVSADIASNVNTEVGSSLGFNVIGVSYANATGAIVNSLPVTGGIFTISSSTASESSNLR